MQTSVVPGEVSSKTQPFPVLPAPFARQVVRADDLTNRTPEAHASAVKQFETLISGDQQFYPISLGGRETVFAPGLDGGAEWGGPGVDRKSGVIYINSNDVADTGALALNDPHAGEGLATYQQQCTSCHRESRGGSPPEFPSLVGIDKRLTSQQIIDVIHSGRGRMPSFPNLQERRLLALLDYLRTGKDQPSAIPLQSSERTGTTRNSELQHDAVDAATRPLPAT